MNTIEIIKKQPMDDGDIQYYLPDIEIIKYNDLEQFHSIDELLDKPIDYVILLIEFKENEGHWVCLLKYNGCIEYFDSYGKPVNYWLHTSDIYQNPKTLENLLNTHKNVIYNKIEYQDLQNENLATCGRHILNRIEMLKNYNLDCDKYYTLMKYIKDKTNLTYDDIVSNIIQKF